MRHTSEQETIIKRILPYLMRRGYNLDDIDFEEPTHLDTEQRKGFIDLLMRCGKPTPLYLIEAKRDGTKLTVKHHNQAINYGRSKNCLFVAVTNGKIFELLNTTTGHPLKFNGSSFNRLPTRNDLIRYFLPQLKTNPETDNINLPSDVSIPFRAGLPLSKMNNLFKQCHSSIRTIEKDEEHAFADFSKILFLKLLEEKWDSENLTPPYSYLFHELAETNVERADRVQTAIKSMIRTIKDDTKFGEVLADPIRLKKDATYLTIVKRLAAVSFRDCDLDTKGAAFEYFVRATLKGKKLGQYFTPRPLVKLMLALGKYKQIESSLMAGEPFKVLDPACGTGGFLVFAMNMCRQDIEEKLKAQEIHQALAKKLDTALKEETFYGIDANEGVACSAKMNMVIAGDGHTNIRCGDSLKDSSLIPEYKVNAAVCADGKAHLILTNPPFGTSEGESLTSKEINHYDLVSKKGQSLFIQKMLQSIHAGSLIVTVIDDGVLNTATDSELRTHILKNCRIEKIIKLPDETFKPNKINVKSSVLVLKRREDLDEDLQDDYPIPFIKIESMGYDGSGEEIRGFDEKRLIKEVSAITSTTLPKKGIRDGYRWVGFKIMSSEIVSDRTKRFDMKYWNALIIKKIRSIMAQRGATTINKLNLIETKRGKSPSAFEYVSKNEGYALVVKAGTNISKNGELVTDGDYIEENYYKENYGEVDALQDGDILLASTGEGTLGKCCVYRNEYKKGKSRPAIADGHVTVIRVNKKSIYPEFLCDYLRKGFGSEQIERLSTGSTGLIEIQPDDVNGIVIPPLPPISKQMKFSKALRKIEMKTVHKTNSLQKGLNTAQKTFYEATLSI